MKHYFKFLTFTFCFLALAEAKESIQSEAKNLSKKEEQKTVSFPQIKELLKKAHKKNKIPLVIFHANWNEYSKQMNKRIFNHNDFSKIVGEIYEHIILNLDLKKDEQKLLPLLDFYNVRSLPTSLILNNKGETVRTIHYLDGDTQDYIKALKAKKPLEQKIPYLMIRNNDYISEYFFPSRGSKLAIDYAFNAPDQPIDIDKYNKIYKPHLANKTEVVIEENVITDDGKKQIKMEVIIEADETKQDDIKKKIKEKNKSDTDQNKKEEISTDKK